MTLKSKLKSLFESSDHMTDASSELAEARRELLKAQTGLEYAKAMVMYHTDRINRLSRLLQGPVEKET